MRLFKYLLNIILILVILFVLCTSCSVVYQIGFNDGFDFGQRGKCL